MSAKYFRDEFLKLAEQHDALAQHPETQGNARARTLEREQLAAQADGMILGAAKDGFLEALKSLPEFIAWHEGTAKHPVDPKFIRRPFEQGQLFRAVTMWVLPTDRPGEFPPLPHSPAALMMEGIKASLNGSDAAPLGHHLNRLQYRRFAHASRLIARIIEEAEPAPSPQQPPPKSPDFTKGDWSPPVFSVKQLSNIFRCKPEYAKVNEMMPQGSVWQPTRQKCQVNYAVLPAKEAKELRDIAAGMAKKS